MKTEHTQRNMTSYIGIVVFLVIVVGALIFFGNTSITPMDTTGETPYTDHSGNPVSFSDHEGKVLVVNSWASWCPFCVEELPDFALLGEEFADEVVVIAINRRESVAEADVFLASIDNPRYIEFWLDPDDEFYRSIGAFAMPETLFIDRAGNTSFHKRGFMPLEEMREHTLKALNQ